MKKIKLTLAFVSLLVFSMQAQIAIVQNSDATDLANTLIGTEAGITVVSATYIGADVSAGIFTGGAFGISQGILLTSGNALNAAGPNNAGGSGTNVSQPGDEDLDSLAAPFFTQDASILEIEFTATGNVVEFTYVFGSEEYNEYVCSSFNDVFGFFVSGGAYSNQNIALLPGSDPPIPVSINNVNNGTVGNNGNISNCSPEQLSNSVLFVDNVNGTNVQYDGYTVPLNASIEVEPGTTYTLRLAIADAGDGSLDSGVFIEAGSIVSVNCDAGELSYEQYDVTDLSFCFQNLPINLVVENSGVGQNDDYVYILVDAEGTIVALADDNVFNTEDLAIGSYTIYGVSYAGAITGLSIGLSFDALDADGCIQITEPLGLENTECDEFDCPELQANNGDACENEEGEEGTLVDCECEVEVTFDCEGLAANNGDACENEEGEEGTLVDCECEVEVTFECEDLEANNGDACENDLGEEGTLVDCECEVVVTFDCEDLEANNGDACENANGEEGVLMDCQCEVETSFDCPELMINVGDLCSVGGQDGIVSANCECVTEMPTSDCTNFVYYLSDVANDGSSEIYKVELDATSLEAELTLLKEVDYEVHIAYNQTESLLYLIRSSTGAFRSLDVSIADGAMSAEISLSTAFTKATAAAFNVDGKLLIADQNSNEIISVNILDGVRSPFANGDVWGGDLAFGLDGNLYLATRSGNILYSVNPGFPNAMIGTVPNLVTGMALMADGNLLLSSRDADQLVSRNSDGSDSGLAYALRLNGATFTTNNGDLASGCNDNQLVEDCNNFRYLYSASNTPGVSQGTVFEGVISGSDFVLTELFSAGISSHIAMNTANGDIYVVNGNGSEMRTYDASGILVSTVSLSLSQAFAVVYNPADGQVYIGSANQNKVYAVNPADGTAVLFASNVPVDGGDLVLNNAGELFLIERLSGASKLYNISSGTAVLVSNVAPEINGAAITSDGSGFIMAEGLGSSTFHMYDVNGMATTTLNAVDNEGNAFVIFDGDMASGCLDNEPITSDECYGNSIFEFVPGLKKNGQPITDPNRTDPNKALGAPQINNTLNFVSLGFGGSITLSFDAEVAFNGPGDDIQVVETTYGNIAGSESDFATYPESAEVFVSQDDVNYFSVGTVFTDQAATFDIDNAGQGFAYITSVKVVDSTPLNSVSGDGFDLDGIAALNGCGTVATPAATVDAAPSTLTSYPNPTNGPSQVVFTSSETSRTSVEVYDMNGRNVAILFNQIAQKGQSYRLNFHGAALPNGIYIYKMTTNKETIIEKFMISK